MSHLQLVLLAVCYLLAGLAVAVALFRTFADPVQTFAGALAAGLLFLIIVAAWPVPFVVVSLAALGTQATSGFGRRPPRRGPVPASPPPPPTRPIPPGP